jgi:hypothetical protein
MDANPTYPMIYHPLEGDWTLTRATNKAIRALCQIMVSMEGLTEEQRAMYAIEGELVIPKEGETTLSHSILYRKRVGWAAIAEVLFTDFPKVGRLTGNGYEIADQDVFDEIDMAEVRRAFDDFFLSFGVIPPELAIWSSLLSTHLRRTTVSAPTPTGYSSAKISPDGGEG